MTYLPVDTKNNRFHERLITSFRSFRFVIAGRKLIADS